MRALVFVLSILAARSFFLMGSSSKQECVRPSGSDVLTATFSITAFDPQTGDLGVQSKFPNVRAIVPWAEAGVGAVATQTRAKVQKVSP